MKEWLLKVLATAALKSAIAYSHSVVVLVVDALSGILSGGNINSGYVSTIESVLAAAQAVRDFLEKLKSLFGVEETAELSGADPRAVLAAATDKLNGFTKSI